MHGDGYAIAVYVGYALVALGLTAWLARTLFRNGAAFLYDVFEDRPALAEAVNRLLTEPAFRERSAGLAGEIAAMPGPDEVAKRLERDFAS